MFFKKKLEFPMQREHKRKKLQINSTFFHVLLVLKFSLSSVVGTLAVHLPTEMRMLVPP